MARGVAVHVALNTTVYGGELAGLADAVRAVAASGADAVICQDLAVAKLIGGHRGPSCPATVPPR